MEAEGPHPECQCTLYKQRTLHRHSKWRTFARTVGTRPPQWSDGSGGAAPAQANTIEQTFGAPIKQYPGQVQVTRFVKVKVSAASTSTTSPGLRRRLTYWASAVEYQERHIFERHLKGWGAPSS